MKTLDIAPEREWVFSFSIKDSNRNGLWAEIVENGKKTVSISGMDGKCVVSLQTYEKDTPLKLTGRVLDGKEHTIYLVWREHRVELWADGSIADEEWPIGTCFHTDKALITAYDNIDQLSFSDDLPVEPDENKVLENAQYWSPEQGRINVGDCMPFYDGERFHLYYLKDRNGHQSKWRLGAHQYAHISSADLKNWVEHPMAVPITHQWEGSICTGSVLKANDLFYAFYAVRMSDGTSAKVSWATSHDGIHFEKSERYFSLHYPYETTSVRDPEVFLGADGKYHMILTASWLETQPEERNGCLAHMISDDLENWEERSPFLIPGYTDQPECCDYFEWNGWYYLIFSNYGFAKYRYSRQPFGPWIRPEQEMIGSALYRVPKTAAFTGNRRIAVGFLANAVDGDSYAGNAVFRELIQAEDGTLGTAPVPEMTKEFGKRSAVDLTFHSQSDHHCTEVECIYKKQLVRGLGGEFSFRARMEAEDRNTTYGFALEFDTGVSYEIRLEPFREKAAIVPVHSSPYQESEKTMLYQVKGLERQTWVTVVFYKGILDIYLNDRDSLICRLKDTENADSCRLSCFAKDGAAAFKIYTAKDGIFNC